MLTWQTIMSYAEKGNLEPPRRLELSEEEWKRRLPEDVYRITRQHGTERAFTGEFCASHEAGCYACACCGQELFDSEEKFDSGSGWPSFVQPIKANAIKYIVDHSHGMTRVETQCNVCDAHLGHVFPDGPPPSCLRFCINSLAIAKT